MTLFATSDCVSFISFNGSCLGKVSFSVLADSDVLLLVFAFNLPHPRGPLAIGLDLMSVRGAALVLTAAGAALTAVLAGFSVVSVNVVSSELTLLVDLLTLSIELVGGLEFVEFPFSLTSGTLGGNIPDIELFLLIAGEVSALSGSLIGTRALISLLVLVFLNLENSFRTK